MRLLALILLLPSLCNTLELSNRHVETLFRRAQNASIPTVTLAPVTNFDQSLVSLSDMRYERRLLNLCSQTDSP